MEGITLTILRYFLRYFFDFHRTNFSRFRGTFHSFDPVGFAIFAIGPQAQLDPAGKADAQKAIEVGELAKADALLADVETEQRRALDRLAVNAAETSARRGEIALTRLRYAEAATHFANAAALFPLNSAYDDKRIDYLTREASALYLQGSEFGDNDALLASIGRFKRLVEMTPLRARRDWVNAQTHLGLALECLGEREAGVAKLEEAVFTFREALQEATRGRMPLHWATTQKHLGFALYRLGEREVGTARFEEAVFAYHEALKEITPERVPVEWASTQSDLGLALWRLGQRESGTPKLEKAVFIYREALKEASRERAPLLWATIQSNLGLALSSLAEREGRTARFEEAVFAYREALKERTRERVPLYWAMTQSNLGTTLQSFGERESGTTKLEEAVAAFSEALKERDRERVPLQWAYSFGKQGVALMLLAERRKDAALGESALTQITVALQTVREGGDDSTAAYYERQLSKARSIVARLRGQ